MTKPANGQVTTLSMGYNLSSTIIGGLTPLIINYLVIIDVSLVGVFVSLSSLTLFASLLLSKKKLLAI
ncbi:hypothetical protein M0H72_RS17680 [Providencia rettgeri]|nr:hypothetical protein [Providencia rettgeri]